MWLPDFTRCLVRTYSDTECLKTEARNLTITQRRVEKRKE
jgi:hypothetical protein